eukprot:g54824.t1
MKQTVAYKYGDGHATCILYQRCSWGKLGSGLTQEKLVEKSSRKAQTDLVRDLEGKGVEVPSSPSPSRWLALRRSVRPYLHNQTSPRGIVKGADTVDVDMCASLLGLRLFANVLFLVCRLLYRDFVCRYLFPIHNKSIFVIYTQIPLLNFVRRQLVDLFNSDLPKPRIGLRWWHSQGFGKPLRVQRGWGAASKIRVIPPQLVPWTNARFANFLTTCGYDFTSTPSRLEGKLSPEGLMKRCKIPKSVFVSHFASVHGKLEKVKLEYAKVALSTVEEEERFLPYKKPPRGDKLAKINMQDLVGKGGCAVATIEGNHLFCYELAANADPRWQQKNIKLGELPVHILKCFPDAKVLTVLESLQTPLPCCSG